MKILRPTHPAVSTNMVRLNGWNRRGERLVSDAPMGHWETVTFIAGLRNTGIVAPMLIKGAMNGEAFLAYIKQCLVPTLKRKDIVVADNVPFPRLPVWRRRSSLRAQAFATCRSILQTLIP